MSKKKFSKLCEEGLLLDKTKYKRNKNPKISVVIPYYIVSKNLTITMTLRSIQNQSLKDFEIIIVDDGSLEEKIEEVLNEMKNDNRIILLRHKERKGTLLTRVDGIRYASGNYIIQIDQDDMYLNNLLFEKLYNKSKELDIDLICFNYYTSYNQKVFRPKLISIPKNVIIKQPKLRTEFLSKRGENRLYNCKIRMIWNFFTRKSTFIEAIEDLGDEYMNHIFRLYEDTLMMFELSQVASSFYYYDIVGYRHNTFRSGQSINKNKTLEKEILALNQLLFMKLMLYKIDPKYDRYHIYKELGFISRCGNEAKYLNKKDYDLGLEVVEAVFELERIYKNTAPELIKCINKIKNILKHNLINI
jgi:glycosyltransferase involved in cell wall biosynthesis